MKLRLKEDPREWRKSVLLLLLPLAIIFSVLFWRAKISAHTYFILIAVEAVLAVCAVIWPQWFRSYYRWSMRAGFYSALIFGRFALLIFFVLIITPTGFLLRLSGKDSLKLRRSSSAKSYWENAKEPGPLDRLF